MCTQVQTKDITVRSAYGTYQTSTVQGMKASCTAGDKQAAQRLGEKLSCTAQLVGARAPAFQLLDLPGKLFLAGDAAVA